MEQEFQGQREQCPNPSKPHKRPIADDTSEDTKEVIKGVKRWFCPEGVPGRVTDWVEQNAAEASGARLPCPTQSGENQDVAQLGQLHIVQPPSSQYSPDSVDNLNTAVSASLSRPGTRLVMKEDYRGESLEKNNMRFLDPEDEELALPASVSAAYDMIWGSRKASPPPLSKRMLSARPAWKYLQIVGIVPEADIANWLQEVMFPPFSEAYRNGLKLEAPAAFDLVPGANNVAYPVALPIADLAYG